MFLPLIVELSYQFSYNIIIFYCNCTVYASLAWPDRFFLCFFVVAERWTNDGKLCHSTAASSNGWVLLKSVNTNQWPINNHQNLAVLCTKRLTVVHQTLFRHHKEKRKKQSGYARLCVHVHAIRGCNIQCICTGYCILVLHACVLVDKCLYTHIHMLASIVYPCV